MRAMRRDAATVKRVAVLVVLMCQGIRTAPAPRQVLGPFSHSCRASLVLGQRRGRGAQLQQVTHGGVQGLAAAHGLLQLAQRGR